MGLLRHCSTIELKFPFRFRANLMLQIVHLDKIMFLLYRLQQLWRLFHEYLIHTRFLVQLGTTLILIILFGTCQCHQQKLKNTDSRDITKQSFFSLSSGSGTKITVLTESNGTMPTCFIAVVDKGSICRYC